jgi:hypothetical protein
MHPEIVKELSELGMKARFDLGDGLTGFEGKGRRAPGKVDINQ